MTAPLYIPDAQWRKLARRIGRKYGPQLRAALMRRTWPPVRFRARYGVRP